MRMLELPFHQWTPCRLAESEEQAHDGWLANDATPVQCRPSPSNPQRCGESWCDQGGGDRRDPSSGVRGIFRIGCDGDRSAKKE